MGKSLFGFVGLSVKCHVIAGKRQPVSEYRGIRGAQLIQQVAGAVGEGELVDAIPGPLARGRHEIFWWNMLQHVRRLLQAGCHHVVALVLAVLAFKVDGIGQPRFPAPGQKIPFVQRLHPCPLLIMVAAVQLHWCSALPCVAVAHGRPGPRGTPGICSGYRPGRAGKPSPPLRMPSSRNKGHNLRP